MRLVHLADTHLGYRAYHRVTSHGVNLREADVARAFREAIDKTIELRPDLVVVAGDVFHTVRPSNAAIADAFRQLARLRDALRRTPVVVIAGNHDTPRSVETGSILRLFEEIPGVHVAYHGPRRLALRELDASVLCLPYAALRSGEVLAIEPEPTVSTNVLVVHAALDDPRVRFFDEYNQAWLPMDAWKPEQWSYTALGAYHQYQRFHPNAAYAGGIERTSSNIWAEAGVEKGFIEFDTERGALAFHPLESPRPVLDLPSIDALGRTAEELDAELEARLESVEGGIEGKIVRVRFVNCPRPVYRDMDHQKIRQARARATHLHLDVRTPESVRSEASGAPGRRATLEEEVQHFLRTAWTPSSPDVDREELVALALAYLREPEETAGG